MSLSKNLFLIPIFIFALACEEVDEGDDFGISISPEANYLTREPGNVVNFTINANSVDDFVRYRVTENINNQATTILKDVSIRGKAYSDWFDYTVPDSLDFGQNNIELIFGFFDSKGKEMRRAKIINVNIKERLLDEYGGNTMYSSGSNQFDAYDLLTNTPKYSSDSTSHIRDITKSSSPDSLSRAWTSPIEDIKFVKFNSFDYANATNESVRLAFETGVKNDTIRNLRDDDIILTKIEENFIAVKLIFVADPSGNSSDRYVFSTKR